MERQHVIIVGAGASGLYAASEIAKKCAVTIIEANDYAGGRMHTLKDQKGQVIEAGAEFVHGDTPVTSKVLKQAGLRTVALDGKMLRKEGTKWEEEEDMIEGWDELVEKMKGQESDITMQQFMDEHFAGEKYTELRSHIKAFVGGFDVADTNEISVKSLYEEWSNEGEQRRVEGGYVKLVDYLTGKCRAAGCELITGQKVQHITWQKDHVTVATATGRTFSANKIVVSVAVGALRSNTIRFTPTVDRQSAAVGRIGYGTVVKVIFDFKEKLWKENTGFIFSNEQIPTWWTQHPVKNNLITGWAGGPVAAKFSQHTDDEVINIALQSLANIFDTSVEKLRNIIESSYVFNWSKNEESLGAYSFSTPDSASARKILNEPLKNTLFFAGEGLYHGPYTGTVEAALDSGEKVARKLLDTVP